jgi:uroporphyrinogen-III synthase
MPVKSILVSQPKPPDYPKSPYQELTNKFKVKVDFRQFIEVVGIPAREFRKQRINILDYSAVILTSRNAIDQFFRMCDEMRINMPEMTKYFCVTEAIAVYLQKYILYRKRKVFYGSGKDSDLFDMLNKHIQEKFLLPCALNHKDVYTEYLKNKKANFTEAIMYETVPANLKDMSGKINYDMIVLFTPAAVQSLFQNFPNFEQGELRIAAMGGATIKAMEQHGIRIDVKAPTPEAPSIIKALEYYLQQANKRR